MAFIGSISQSGISNGDVKPGVSVMFNVVFKNLGEIGGTCCPCPREFSEANRSVCGTSRDFLLAAL